MNKIKHTIKNKIRAVVGYRELMEKIGGGGSKQSERYYYVGDNTALVRNQFDKWFYIDTRDLGIFPELFSHGVYEPHLLDFFLTVVKPGDVVIEVGANIGCYSITTAALNHPKAYYAFDAHPRMASLLQRNIAFNRLGGSLFGIPKAVSDHNNGVTFSAPTYHPTGAGVLNKAMAKGIEAVSHLASDHIEHRQVIEVTSITIDDFAASSNLSKVDVIKADAEGSEYFILKGAEKTLRDNPNIKLILEYNRPWLSNHVDPKAFCDYIVSLGFKVRIIDPSSGAISPISWAQLEPVVGAELFLSRA